MVWQIVYYRSYLVLELTTDIQTRKWAAQFLLILTFSRSMFLLSFTYFVIVYFHCPFISVAPKMLFTTMLSALQQMYLL